MDSIRLWVTGLTSAAIIGAIVLVVVPGGGAEKTVKTMVSVFLISSIVIPFANGGNWNFETDFSAAESVTETQNSIATAMSEQIKRKLSASVENILLKEGIQVSSVIIDIKTGGDEISVEKITVIMKKESSANVSQAKQILEAQLGVKADVGIEDTED